MRKDPVCGAQVDGKNASSTSDYQGQKYSFCGNECKEKFDKSPERYAQSKQQSGSGQPSHQQGGQQSKSPSGQPWGQQSEKRPEQHHENVTR